VLWLFCVRVLPFLQLLVQLLLTHTLLKLSVDPRRVMRELGLVLQIDSGDGLQVASVAVNFFYAARLLRYSSSVGQPGIHRRLGFR